METKTCVGCGEVKNLDEFYGRGNSTDGKRNKCIPCHIKASNLSKSRKTSPEKREEWLKSVYGISNLEYNRMLLNQNGRCAICDISQFDIESVLVVDHKHDTGEIRGLLCTPCNTGLGMYKEDYNTFTSAVKYLEKYNKKEEHN